MTRCYSGVNIERSIFTSRLPPRKVFESLSDFFETNFLRYIETITIKGKSGTVSLFEMITKRHSFEFSVGFMQQCSLHKTVRIPLSGAVTIIVEQRGLSDSRSCRNRRDDSTPGNTGSSLE